VKLFNTVRDRKGLLEILKGLSDLKGDLILYRDGSDGNVGKVLSPHNGILCETVELRNVEG
jgi:hypothetical protein